VSLAVSSAVVAQMLTMRDFRGCSPLHLAILNGRVHCLELLLAAGANANSGCDGNPPLCMAVCLALLPDKAAVASQLVSLLLSAGARITDT
jgi:ankyrin repeat protein